MTSAREAAARLWAITTRDRIRLADRRVIWFGRESRYAPELLRMRQCRCSITPKANDSTTPVRPRATITTRPRKR